MLQDQFSRDHTMTIYTSSEGSGGSKVSVHKSLLLSALTVKMDKSLAGTDTTNGFWSQAGQAAQQLHRMMKMTGYFCIYQPLHPL